MSSSPASQAAIDAKLLQSRQELLDIGLRNNLISFRKTSKNLGIQNAQASVLLPTLIDLQKALMFEATASTRPIDDKRGPEDIASTGTLLPGYDAVTREQDDAHSNSIGLALSSEGEIRKAISEPSSATSHSQQAGSQSRRVKGASLEVALTQDALALQLLKIRAEAQTFVEEQGANLLFLAVGFLHWYESDSAQELRRAPLVLVPCVLARKSALELYHLEFTGDDVLVNMSLAAKLKADFGINLPVPGQDDDWDSADWLQYLADVESAIAKRARWKVVANEAVLGFFSFGKFLMYKDLDPETWPKGKSPSAHPVIGRLMGEGFGDEHAAYPEDVHVDEVISPGDVHFVKDADSSQTQAILEVRAGCNLVIQGPPGTGKSQTITNLIAELVGQNKTVLFVAEKMAALDVVKRRLDECHLGDAVLELHSHRATKTAVLKELARALDQGRPLNESGVRDIEQLRRVQDELNAYCEAVAEPVGATDMVFSEVLGRLLQLQRQWPDIVPLPIEALERWNEQDYAYAHGLTANMALVLGALGRPKASALWGSQLMVFTPIEENKASQALAQGIEALQSLLQSASDLSERLSLTAPASLEDIDVVCRAARRAAEAPKLDGVQLSTQDWQLRRDALKSLNTAGRGMRAERDRWSEHLIDAAWEQDLLPVRQAVAQYGNKWWKVFSGEWRAAKKRLQGLAKSSLPVNPAQLLGMADGVLAYQQHRKGYEAHATLGQALFGAQWQAEKSDWDVLDRITQWVVDLHDEVGKGQMPRGIVDFLSGHPDASGLGDLATSTEANVRKLNAAVDATVTVLGLSASDWASRPLAELDERLREWREQLPQLNQMARFNALADQFKEAQLDPLLLVAQDCKQAETLMPQLELSWFQSLVQQAYKTHAVLARFDRLEHEHRIQRFKDLDLASIEHAKTRLATEIWKRKPHINQSGEMATIRNELNKKRKHLPIRQLIDRASGAIQQLKPVFMMSPMSIANFLPPGKVEFDVVIFDEASQVKAVDALGAILRGKQIVVVGDTRQMPPTDFFSRDVEHEEETATADVESILSLFKAKGCNERYLRWHYRSRHESLIAVSNAEFYDSKLVVFPTAGSNLNATGISLEYLPDALYDRGKTRTNPEEARAVANAVLAHARLSPHLSLGVAAFSVAQRDRIEEEVEKLRRQHPETESFFAAHPSEPFFVKNLENIQGDERDVVFISIGYGRNESGRIAKEFGPLNRDGGHRRLNVLITRAKMAMRIFSNFRGDELELDASVKHGVRALKNLLKYAETRQLETSVETGRATDSPFEDQVLAALRDRGYQLEPQVGTAGYFIDMGVRDPDMPGRYILAIECDGAAYHSARSARDRDRLRQGVLEGLGWRFHRIWSTDWFRNPVKETDRAVEVIEAARAALKSRDEKCDGIADDSHTPTAVHTKTTTLIRACASLTLSPTYSVPYSVTQFSNDAKGNDLLTASQREIQSFIVEVVNTEAPVSTAIVIRRLMGIYGVTRAGTRITARIEEVLEQCVHTHQWLIRDDFICLPEQVKEGSKTVVRDRASLPAAERKIEFIAPQELQAALCHTIEQAFSIEIRDAVSEVSQMLGFGRASAKIASEIEAQVAILISSGQLVTLSDGRMAMAELETA